MFTAIQIRDQQAVDRAVEDNFKGFWFKPTWVENLKISLKVFSFFLSGNKWKRLLQSLTKTTGDFFFDIWLADGHI